jgi:Protein of unknown function (DUF3088)
MTATAKEKPILFLLAPDFADAAHPGQRFFCPHCAMIEGVLSLYPRLVDELDIRRIAFPRPRPMVIELIGEANQSMPQLVLPPGESSALASGEFNGRAYASGEAKIIEVLVERYGISSSHP